MFDKTKFAFEDTNEEVWPVAGQDGNVVRLFTSELAAQAYAQVEGLQVMSSMRVAKAESVWSRIQVTFDTDGTPSFGPLEKAHRRADATCPLIRRADRLVVAVYAYTDCQTEIIAHMLCDKISARRHDNPDEPLWACIHEETRNLSKTL